MDEEYFEASIDPDIDLQLKGEIIVNINANVKKKQISASGAPFLKKHYTCTKFELLGVLGKR